MRKITLLFSVLLIIAYQSGLCQPITYYEAPLYDNSTSTGRGPNGTSAHTYMRACALVLATELTNIANSSTITSFGFTLNSGGATSAATGNFTLYLQNTTDVTYNKGTNFSTALTGMTQVYASTMTIPISATTTSITVTLSTPFVYTGGGIYVAYDWYNPGPYSTTAAVYRCNSGGLSPGLASAASTASAPATLATTAFRPCYLFGVANPYTNDIQFIGMEAPGRVSSMFNTPHFVKALIKNSSSVTNTNIVVSLNVSGANTFVDTQTITSLGAGAITTVTFSAFNPQLPGLNTLSVTVPSDQNNANNLGTYTQSVSCNEWALNPAAVNYTMGSVGFNTGSGIIAVTYSNPAVAVLKNLRGAVSTNTPSIGNNTWGVLMSSGGSIIATTNTMNIASNNLGTFVTFTFNNPPTLAANTNYLIGFAQPTGTLGYFPMGTYTSAYVPYTNYVTTTTVGSTPAPLTSNLGYFGIEAIFEPNIPMTVPSQSVVCGNSASLTVTGVPSYTWINGPVSTSYVVTPTINTTYTVTATNTIGCVANKTVAVTVNPIPVSAFANDSLICLGDVVTISATGAPSYSWSSGPNPTLSSFTVSPSATTMYSVVGSNSTGCTNTSSVTIVVTSFTNLTVSAQNVVLCLGNSHTLTASGAITYTWNTSTGVSTTAVIQETPQTSGVYTITGSDVLGCKDARTVTVTVNSFTPGVTSSTAICIGNQITLNATGAAPNTYTWNGNFPFSGISVSPSVTTTYSVVAFGFNGCQGNAATTVSVNPNPTVQATANRTVMCKGETNTITASGASTYSWSSGENTPTVSMTATVNLPYFYSVKGTDVNGCSDSRSLTIIVNNCTGVDENNLQAGLFNVFPNPNNGQLTVKLEAVPANTYITILNALGQEILAYEVTNNAIQVNLENQANGIYFVRLETAKKTVGITKIVKQ